MSALMPETNRKNCVDPTVFPMRRQNTSNQTHANASTRAAQLTANIPILKQRAEQHVVVVIPSRDKTFMQSLGKLDH